MAEYVTDAIHMLMLRAILDHGYDADGVRKALEEIAPIIAKRAAEEMREKAAEVAAGFDWSTSSDRNRFFVATGLMDFVAERDEAIAAAIRELEAE